MSAREHRVAAPQPRIGIDRVAVVQRPPGGFRFLFELADHPRAGGVDPALPAHERGDRRRRVLVERSELLVVDALEEGRDLARFRSAQPDVARVRENDRVMGHQIGVHVARLVGGVADQALDQIGLAGALLELARMLQQLLRRSRQDRLATAHQPGLLEQSGVDVEQAAVRVPRHSVNVPANGHALEARLGKIARVDAGFGKDRLERLEQPFRRIIGNHTAVHGHDVGGVARRHLRRQLRIAGPGDDVLRHGDVRVLGVELVDQRRDDPALALDLRNVGRRSVERAAFAEEALQIDAGALLACAARSGEQDGGDDERAADQRTAVPAIARTICFWKTM